MVDIDSGIHCIFVASLKSIFRHTSQAQEWWRLLNYKIFFFSNLQNAHLKDSLSGADMASLTYVISNELLI